MQRNLVKSACAKVILNTCISIEVEVVRDGWIKTIFQLSNLIWLCQEWGSGMGIKELTLLSTFHVPDNNLRDIIIMPIFKNQGKTPRLRRFGKYEKNHITSKPKNEIV